MTDTDGRHDFDFLYGTWQVAHRQLVASGGDEWRGFDSRSECRGLAGGLVNVDELVTDDRPLGVTVRAFDTATGLWSIYWITREAKLIDTPVVGRFEGGIGEFHGDERLPDKTVRVRFLWTRGDAAGGAGDGTDKARWEQAYTEDDGTTWETNWVMELTRTGS